MCLQHVDYSRRVIGIQTSIVLLAHWARNNKSPCYGRGHHTRKMFTKVTQIVQFIKRHNFGLVPGHLNQWFWSDFTPKLELFKLHMKKLMNKKITPLL